MPKVTDPAQTERRKDDHIRINLEEQVQFPRLTTGLERYRFMHQALPELDLDDVSTETTLFGRRLNSPLLISSMTGGTERAQMINRALAEAAQDARIAMGLGSMRAALEDPALDITYRVRELAPDALLFANLGAVQLNYGYGIDECRRAVDLIQADALVLHLNAVQEAVQPEGDTRFGGLLQRIEAVCRQLEVPVIAKEVGWGISPEAARQLADAGVAAIDVAGRGHVVERGRIPSRAGSPPRECGAPSPDWGSRPPTASATCARRRACRSSPAEGCATAWTSPCHRAGGGVGAWRDRSCAPRRTRWMPSVL